MNIGQCITEHGFSPDCPHAPIKLRWPRWRLIRKAKSCPARLRALELLATMPDATTAQVAQALHRSNTTTYAMLRRLCDAGTISRRGEWAHGRQLTLHWSVKRAV